MQLILKTTAAVMIMRVKGRERERERVDCEE